ncbi:cytosolic factor, phosphatidylinositol/phosphatidylcholine transfer protein [Irineochytrium annulatum]|nr:cytosolic factor, phosphatidylinositol/phosphatidylcholine transfer protein [Irineochytrium annulatum]
MSKPNGSNSHLASVDREGALEHFKRELESAGLFDPTQPLPDDLLNRFLRARKYDLVKAKEMFEAYLKWRVEYKVEELVTSFSFPEAAEVQKYYPRFYHKTDKLGRPVYYELIGAMDIKGLWTVTNQERMIQGFVRDYEKLLRYRLPACSKKAGRHLEQGFTILDMKGVKLTQFNQVRKIVQEVSGIAQNYYPETMGRMFIINAPTLFTSVWSVVRGFLDEATVAKISVVGSRFQEALLQEIDAENLPVEYGGTSDNNPDIGPWNDGTVEGYPIEEWETFGGRDRAVAHV